jgi:type I restriction enzyme S subunit
MAKPRTVRLEDIAYVNPRLSEKIDSSTLVSFVGMADLSADQAVTEAEDVRPYRDVAKGYTAFQDGDLLVAKITPCFENGKIGQARLSHRLGFGSTEFHVVRPHPELADGRFLMHFLRTPQFRAAGEVRMTGSGGQRRVPVDYVSQAQLYLPSLDQQRRIAAILDKADELRTKRRLALAQLDVLAKSIFHSMFGDPVNNSKGWPQQKLNTLGRISTGNTPSRAVSENFGDYVEWVKTDNVNTPQAIATPAREGLSELGARRARIVPSGSVLVTCIAGSPGVIGNVALTDRTVAFNQQINAFTPNSGPSLYWYALLKSMKPLVQKASSGGMKGLVSKSVLSAIDTIVVPDAIQQEFAEHLAAVEHLKNRHESQLAEQDALFASLQHRAFRGEL